MEITGKGLKLLQTIADTSARSKTVQASQTIQEVIDRCSVAVGSLRTGFTNPVVVKVPTGHETEFYSLVRNASDVATDKRNVNVIFENNPEGKFQIELLDDFTEGWTFIYGGAGEYVKSDYLGYNNCLHVYGDGTNERLGIKQTFSPSLDLTTHHGFLFDTYIPLPRRMKQANRYQIQLTDDSAATRNISATPAHSVLGDTPLKTTLFIPFSSQEVPGACDLSSIESIKIFAWIDAVDSPADFYINNLRLVRTSHTPIAVLRIDDGCPYAIDLIPQIIDKGWGASVSMYKGYGSRSGDQDYLSLGEARGLQDLGFEFVNETRDHLTFNTVDKVQTLFQYKANQQFMRQYGFAQGANILLNPYHHSNGWLVEKIKQDGGIQYSGFDKFPASLLYIDNETFATDRMENLLADNQGGVAEIMFHFTETSPVVAFGTFLDYIETHFSHVILATDLLKRYPENVYKYRVPEVDYDYARVESIAADMIFYNMDGGTFKITATEAALNLIPAFEFETRELKVINAGTNSFTFDPTFTAAGAHDGAAEADALTHSLGGWTVGQLVGRTVNNTADSSSGVITDNTETTVSAILSGGTNNYWSIGDTFTITPAGLNQAVGEDQTATFVYDGEGWDITNLYDKSP